jgi:signal transduction histidine kinase
MCPTDNEERAERQQTDESLRAERDRADQSLEQEQDTLEAAADEVIGRARSRADEVLATARAKTDRQATRPPSNAPASRSVQREREVADRALRAERADADAAVRAERAAHVTVLLNERAETDKDLTSERARSDDALARRDEFLATVSHELRNVLSSMVLMARLIADGALRENQAEQIVNYAQRIQRAGGRMDRLIGDLVDVASIEAGVLAVTREPSDAAQVVTEAVSTFQAQATATGLRLSSEVISPISSIALDPARILQVLVNLLSNAIKFTPANGSVSVRVQASGDQLLFSVSDTGLGIAPDKLEAVFERFVQVERNDRRGLGLGLYISKCIVQGHGGRIWVESTLGVGSTFHFTLPLT